jgi:putative methionine-R-sulfoxide reductase with GAF domain
MKRHRHRHHRRRASGKGLTLKVTLDDERPLHKQRERTARSNSLRSGLKRQTYLNWSLLVVAVLIIALGVLTVAPPLLSERLAAMWPWPKPQLALIVVLCLALLVLTGLAHQQRYIALLKKQFEESQLEEVARSRRHTQRLFALLNVSKVLGSSSDLQKVFEAVVALCVEAFSCHQASLMMFDSDTQDLVVRSVAGESVPSTMLDARVKLGEGIAGWAAQKGQSLLIGSQFDSALYPELKLKNFALTSAMVVPIMLRDELIGVLNVSTRSHKTTYDDDDLKALQVFAENVGACVRHTEQASWMRQTIRNLQESVKTQRKQAARTPEYAAPGSTEAPVA